MVAAVQAQTTISSALQVYSVWNLVTLPSACVTGHVERKWLSWI